MLRRNTSLSSFTCKRDHSDIGMLLKPTAHAVRTGHHCAMPLMNRYGIPGTIRASFGLYNSKADVDALVSGIHKSINMLQN